MTMRSRLRSFLGPDIEQFLAHKRALGRRYDTEEKTLALFDDYLLQRRVCTLRQVNSTFVDQFLLSRPRSRPRSYNHLRGTLGRLFAYLVDRGKLAYTPVQSPPRRSSYQRTPFIFDAADAKRLLAVAQSLADKGGTLERGKTYHVLFAVLYGLGLRVSEACRLRIEDVDFDRRVLVIRKTKFYTRVGLCPSVPSSKHCWRSIYAASRSGTRTALRPISRCSACVVGARSVRAPSVRPFINSSRNCTSRSRLGHRRRVSMIFAIPSLSVHSPAGIGSA